MGHLESLHLPGEERLLHIARRNETPDILYYIEDVDGSLHHAGHLRNHNNPRFAFTPAYHTWDHDGNLVGHFRVLLDTITKDQKFREGGWLYLYRINKEDLALEPSSTADSDRRHGSLEVYPNPGTDIVHLDTDLAYTHVAVYATDSKVVHTADDQQGTLDLGHLPPGMYHIALSGSSGIIAQQRWIKVR